MKREKVGLGVRFTLPNFQFFQINFWDFSTVVSRQWRWHRRCWWRHRFTRGCHVVRINGNGNCRNIRVGTLRSRSLDSARRRNFNTCRWTSVKTPRKFSDIRHNISRMSTQIRRHFRWRHAAWREPWQTSNRIWLSFTDARVSAQMVSSLKSVRMQTVWCHQDGSALLFQDKAPRSFPGQCDDVDVFFGVEGSSVALCGAPFTAPGCSSAPCAVCFFNEWKIFRPLFFVAPRFVQSHWNHIKGRTGLGNLKKRKNKKGLRYQSFGLKFTRILNYCFHFQLIFNLKIVS